MKLLIVPKNLELDRFISKGYNSFLFGLDKFSNNMINSIDMDKIEELKNKYANINIFISINKNLFNDEINDITKILIKLNKINISGVLFYDLGIINICKKNNLSIPLIWNQTYMVTNYNTCNYYNNMGCNGAVLASEITLDEVIEICSKTNLNLFVNLFGYPVMAHSNRKLLSNYFTYINKEKNKSQYMISEPLKNEKYIVKEDNTGTSFYNGVLLNASKPLVELRDIINYGIVTEDVDSNIFNTIIDSYQTIINKKETSSTFSDLSKLIGDYTGFFYKKTIYKVKKNG